MTYAEDMCEIIARHAGDGLRVFVHADPETRELTPLHVRSDLEWTDTWADTVDKELQELIAKKSYEAQMDAGEVTQLIKVAEEMVMFTGFIEDEVVVVTFERGILADLPAIVAEFREYMLENDVEFTSLAAPE